MNELGSALIFGLFLSYLSHTSVALAAPMAGGCQSDMTNSVRPHLQSYEKTHGGHFPTSKSAKARMEKLVLTKALIAACGNSRNASMAYGSTLTTIESQPVSMQAPATAAPAVVTAATLAPASASASSGTVAACTASVLQGRPQLLLQTQEAVHGTTFTFITFNQHYQQAASALPGCGSGPILRQTFGTFQVHENEVQDFQASSPSP